MNDKVAKVNNLLSCYVYMLSIFQLLEMLYVEETHVWTVSKHWTRLVKKVDIHDFSLRKYKIQEVPTFRICLNMRGTLYKLFYDK